MPGTPTSRACDACRKRRKRCDLIQPTCSRCQKLHIPCVGGGLQRFIFKSQDISKLVRSSQAEVPISQMQMPSSPPMTVSMSLVNKLQTRHLKFELNWAHGSFMDEIPRRLGHSKALAAATEAFMLAIPCAEVSHTLARRRLRCYTAALHATRLALYHPLEAYSPNTLCAVYLLWICQSWMETPDDANVHPKGLALLLNQPIRLNPLEQFDRGIVYSACTVVTSEKMVLGAMDIDASSRCWSFFNTVNAQSATLSITPPAGESLALTQRLSRLIFAIADFFRSKQTLSEVWTLYNISAAVVADLSRQATEASVQASGAALDSSQDDAGSRSEHAVTGSRGMRGFKFALTLTLIMNGVLSAHYPDSESLADFRNRFTNEAFPMTMNPGQLMPMGAGFMGMFFDHVWAIEDQTTASQTAWDTCGTESANRRSTTFSRKLENTLESLL